MRGSIALVLAYLIGSIPTAFLAGKYSRGIDLRRFGSGNLGATNVYRVLGRYLAAIVWVVDTVKGCVPVVLLPRLMDLPDHTLWPIALGLAAILGHTRPMYLGSGGGKGVATATGVFLGLAWLPTVIAIATWGVVLWRSGYVSLASLVASVALGGAVLVLQGPTHPEFLAAVCVAGFVFWSHRENIARLRRGEEHRFRADSSMQKRDEGAGVRHGRGHV